MENNNIDNTTRMFTELMCEALACWGYNYDGSKINPAAEKMIQSMSEEQLEDLELFTFDHYKYHMKGDTWPDLDKETLVDCYTFIMLNDLVIGYLMEVCPNWIIDMFELQLDNML